MCEDGREKLSSDVFKLNLKLENWKKSLSWATIQFYKKSFCIWK